MEATRKIVSAPMGAAAVRPGKNATGYLCHAVELDADDCPARVLCGKAKPQHILADDSLYGGRDAVDCPACLRKWKP